MPGTIVDMHVHTVRGAADSSLTPDQLVEVAGSIGLTGVNITEHDRVWEPHLTREFREQSGLFVNPGMEVSTDMGHIIALGLTQYMPGIRRATELRRV
jgi:predicted metal-dependent phosphoesterase TrpH